MPGRGVFQGARNLIRTEVAPDGQYHPALNDEVLKELIKVKDKLVVVSIVGPYRSGKSYLLTKLAKYAGSTAKFKVGHTIEPETKGLWIMVIDHPRRRDVKIALVDTEGIGDTQKGDSQHDATLFVLTSLLSNIMIYNGKNAIDEAALEKFRYPVSSTNGIYNHNIMEMLTVKFLDNLIFTAEMSKFVASKASSQDDEALRKIFPQLVYVVRDFSLEAESNGRQITADQYLENALQVPANADPTAPRSKVRTCIKRYFQRRRCFTLDVPAAGRRTLKQMDAEEGELNPDFLEEMERLCRFILGECDASVPRGRLLNGQQLGALTETYVNAYKTGTIPNISTAMDDLKMQENKKALDHAERQYLAAMEGIRGRMPLRDVEVTKNHREICHKAFTAALEIALLDGPDEERRFREKLQATLDAKKKALVDENRAISRSQCEESLESLYLPIRERKGSYSCIGGYSKYQADLLKLRRDYDGKINKSIFGDIKDTVWSEFKLHRIKPDEESIRDTDKKLAILDQEQIDQKRREERNRREREWRNRLKQEAGERRRKLQEEEREEELGRERKTLVQEREARERERARIEGELEERRREMEEAAADMRREKEKYEDEMRRQKDDDCALM